MHTFKRQSNNYWLVPLLYILSAIIVAIVGDTLDHSDRIRVDQVVPDIFLTKARLAESILSAIATSLLTMTTITFSVMMVVLSTNASQYTPRTLPNFIKSKTMEHAQGIFFAGFTYAIVALLLLKRSKPDDLIPDAAVGVGIAVVCLMFFVYFIHRVSQFIRVNTLIQIVSGNAQKLIEVYRAVGNFVESSEDTSDGDNEGLNQVFHASDDGYVAFVDINKVIDKGLRLRLRTRIGEFVRKGDAIYEIRGGNPLKPSELKKLVAISKVRTEEQDLIYVMEKITETGLRAISPGINDPNTAIYCIRELSLIISKLGSWRGRDWVAQGQGYKLEVPFITFEEMLYQVYYQLTHYGAQDVSVMHALLKSLLQISLAIEQDSRESVRKIGDYVYDQIDRQVLHKLDKDRLDAVKQAIDRS